MDVMFDLCVRFLSKDPLKARETALELKQLGESVSDDEAVGKAHIILGRVCYKALQLEKAEQHYRNAIALLTDTVTDMLLLFRAKMALGMVFWAHGECDTALTMYNELLPLLDDSDEHRIFKADLYTNIGNTYERKGEPITTEKYYTMALEVIEGTSQPEEGLYIRSNLAILKGRNGNYPDAIEELKVCLEGFKNEGNKRDMSIVRINLAITYCEMKLYAESLEEYQHSIKLLKELNDERSLISVFAGMSDVYLELKGYKEVMKLSSKTIELARTIGMPTGLFDGLMAQSKAHLGLGNREKAQKAYDEALIVANEKGLTFALDGHKDLVKAMSKASKTT